MSKSEFPQNGARRAVALQYGPGNGAPVVVASGMGYLAEKIVEVAAEHGVPVYEDNSLATILSQLQLGQEIPESLYQAIVDIYVFFLEFDPNNPNPNTEANQVEHMTEREEPNLKVKEGN